MSCVRSLYRCLAVCVLVIASAQVTWSQRGFYATHTASRCFSVPGIPRLELNQCQPGELILVQEAFQGVSRRESGRQQAAGARPCEYQRDDCIQPVTDTTDVKLHEECMGLESCSITVGLSWMRTCSDYSRYNFVAYQCIPQEDSLDVCATQTKVYSRVAFLRSPGYPNKYQPNHSCHCNISTAVHQRILLRFPDCSLQWSENCEKDVLLIEDGESSMPRCGKLPRTYNITSATDTVRIHFKTDSIRQEKGFWIVAEALGKMTVTCGPTSPDTTTTISATSTTSATTATPSTSPTTARPAATTETNGSDKDLDPDGANEIQIVVKETGDMEGFLFTDDFFTPEVYYNTLRDNSFYRQEGGPGYYTDSVATKQISTLVAIIIGCVLLCIMVLVAVFLIIWFKKRTHTEVISKPHQDGHVTHLRRHRAMSSPPHPQSITPRGSPHSSRASTPRMEEGHTPVYDHQAPYHHNHHHHYGAPKHKIKRPSRGVSP